MPYNYVIGGLTAGQLRCVNIYWPEHPQKPKKNIDYILMCNANVGEENALCNKLLSDSLEKHYILLKQDNDLYLYRSKEFK